MTFDAVKQMLEEQSELFIKHIDSLKAEITTLKTELAAVRESQAVKASASPPTMVSIHQSEAPLVNAVRETVKAVMNDESSKNDVIIAKATENGNDDKFVDDLCEKLEFQSKPIGSARMGRKKSEANYERLLKLTFANSFDARAFRTRFEAKRKSKSNDELLKKLRMREGRNKEEQTLYKRLSTEAYKLNMNAKAGGELVSYSVRNTGKIWKYAKLESGKWERVTNWIHEVASSQSGNELPPPMLPQS